MPASKERSTAAAAKSAQIEAAIEQQTQHQARYIWNRLSHRSSSIFERRWWDERILQAAMADESVKVQMFRFVDVLPRLRNHVEITRHFQEYFEDVRSHLPWAVQLLQFGVEQLGNNSVLSRAVAYNARTNAERMARRFIAGSSPADVLSVVSQLRGQGFAVTLDWLGEAVISDVEAEAYRERYLDLLSHLGPVVSRWAPELQVDGRDAYQTPRLNLSIKLSALVSRFRPIDPQGTRAAVLPRLRELLRAARDQQAYLHVDMEQYSYKRLTWSLFREVLLEDEFRDFADVGIVAQSYLRDTDRDLAELRQWVEERGTPITVRLVKGAYWDYETVHAGLQNWPAPVHLQKWESDAAYERQTRFLLEHWQWLRPAFGSHNLRSLAHAVAAAEVLKVPRGGFELQMLYGMATEQADMFRDLGHRVRIYTPFGALIPGMAYLVRRLLENTSNDSFLRRAYDEHQSLETLLMNPVEVGRHAPPPAASSAPRGFVNEPAADFADPEVQQAFRQALETVAEQFDEGYSVIIGGRRQDSRHRLKRENPSRTDQVIGRVAVATTDQALTAIEAARKAFRGWARTEPDHRAEYLDLLAREMRQRRYELAAWEVHECGKPWAEADADVCEAIDFCVYYAQQMRALGRGERVDQPGEENQYFYRPRGVVAVIAPWNFPLAILTGMTAAALVTGNTVVMKPAEQSSVVAAKLMEMLEAIGLPDGVVNFLPGVGEEIGPVLVGSPDVNMIAFTGSRAVGLQIQQAAAQPHAAATSIKEVIVELGGKNAIIVDSDADQDEAVLGVLISAFGYSGQKCSACSRVIVVDDDRREFLTRLVEAAKTWTPGPADEPGSLLGPVIDADAKQRLEAVIEEACAESARTEDADGHPIEPEIEHVLTVALPDDLPPGHYVAPHIFVCRNPRHRLAQEELFGPVLTVFHVKTFAEALALANNTAYALTGGVYSRSPANLKAARLEFQVGNLYLNRPITGAIVSRQPFGGYRLSGTGSKAGGPDYLPRFMIPINITENTLRRGFAPPVHEAAAVGAPADDHESAPDDSADVASPPTATDDVSDESGKAGSKKAVRKKRTGGP